MIQSFFHHRRIIDTPFSQFLEIGKEIKTTKSNYHETTTITVSDCEDALMEVGSHGKTFLTIRKISKDSSFTTNHLFHLHERIYHECSCFS